MMKNRNIISMLLGGAVAVTTAWADTVEVYNSSIVGTVNWYATNTYVLNGSVYVENGEVLNIEAGTVIKGKTNQLAADIAMLVVCRGGKILANGTCSRPIIFTSILDDVLDPEDLNLWDRGLWGGVVLMGRATLNTAVNAGGNAATPKYDVYEGLLDIENHRYGGNDDDDSSGSLRYVSIRHGGKVLESNKEINGLSLCAVGRGTTIEFVETYAIKDDGFEFFGGTVNTKYLVSAFNDDDAFDTDQGYRGKNQFWFALQAPDVRDKGMELNGEPNGNVKNNPPVGAWEVYNVTLIGAGAAGSGSGNNGFTIRDVASPSLYNGIFTDFEGRGVSIDASSGTFLTNGTLNLANNLWYRFKGGANPNSDTNLAITPQALVLFTEASRSNLITDPMLRGISRTNNGALDPRPAPGSPALSQARAVPNNGFYTPVNYVGAFGSLNWASDWTALGAYGVFTGAGAGTPTMSFAAPPPRPTLSVVRLAPGRVVLSWVSQAGSSYQVQSTTNLSIRPIPWSNEGAGLTGTGSALTSTNAVVGPRKFFRVQAQ